MSGEKKNYKVVITSTKEHEYFIEGVNSPEEAEDTAHEWHKDGEDGTIVFNDSEVTDTYAFEDEEEIC